MRPALTFARWALQASLWLVLCGFVALAGLSRVSSFEALVVRSGSMSPTISTGSIVVVDRNARSPAVGAITSFRQADGSVVTHRVVRIEAGLFVTRGDANRSDDATHRSQSTVYGTVVFSLPWVGYLLHALQEPAVFLTLLLGAGGLLVLGSLGTIKCDKIRLPHRPERIDAD